MDKSVGGIWIYDRNEFQNVVDIVQWTKKAEEKMSLLVYNNEMISWNYCSWNSKYNFTIAILIKTELV